jgi:hypothetical protein
MAFTVTPPRAPFLGERLGEAVDSGLGGGVIDLAVLAGLAVDRADIDDAAELPLLHPLEHRLGHVEAAAEIDVDHLVPHLAGHPLHRRVAGDSGIVDEDVDRPQLRLDLAAAFEAGVEIADVPFVGLDSGPRGEVAAFSSLPA